MATTESEPSEDSRHSHARHPTAAAASELFSRPTSDEASSLQMIAAHQSRQRGQLWYLVSCSFWARMYLWPSWKERSSQRMASRTVPESFFASSSARIDATGTTTTNLPEQAS